MVPQVSVIVPVYNTSKYLQRCLDSLVAQTLAEIEILVVNDGSTDDSQRIIDSYASRFPDRIKAFQKENGGLSDARNFGLEYAQGKYIGFVDSDDFVDERMFESLYDLATKYQAEIAICNLQKVDESGRVFKKMPQSDGYPEKVELSKDFRIFADLGYFACNKIFKRVLFEHHRFQKGMHFEDIDLIPRLVLESQTLVFSSGYFYQYSERENSISRLHNEKGLDILKAVQNVEKAFESSQYASYHKALEGFRILQGVYSFLAYLAYVKDDATLLKMNREFKDFRRKRKLSLPKILAYNRFAKNYLLSLPKHKIAFYLLYFMGGKMMLEILQKWR